MDDFDRPGGTFSEDDLARDGRRRQGGDDLAEHHLVDVPGVELGPLLLPDPALARSRRAAPAAQPADFTSPNPTSTHDTVLFEWTAKNPAAATYDGGAPRELIRIRQPFANHNAGQLAFNPLAAPGSADPLAPARTVDLPKGAVSSLVVVGGNSPTWMHNGTRALADLLRNARHRVLEGQQHAVKPKVLAPLLVDFFGQAEGAAGDRAPAHGADLRP